MKHAVLQRSAQPLNFEAMAEGLCYKLYFRFGGKSVLLATNSAVAQARLRTAYGKFLSAEPARPQVTVELGSVEAVPAHRQYLGYRPTDWIVACDRHPAVLYDGDESHATFTAIGIMHHLLIQLLAIDAVVFHAAVLSLDDKLVLIPGRAGIGKSTIAASLIGLGLKLLSDELAPVNPDDLSISPCPLPIGLRNGDIRIDERFRQHVVGSIRHIIGDEDRTIYELDSRSTATQPGKPVLLVVPDPQGGPTDSNAEPAPSSTVIPHLLRASYCDPIELRTFDTCVKLAGLPQIRVGRVDPAINAKLIKESLAKMADDPSSHRRSVLV